MKNLLIAALAFLITNPIFGQQDQKGISGIDLEEHLTFIDQEVEQINRNYHYQIQTLLNEEFQAQATAGGGQLTAYFLGGQVFKIETRIFLDKGRLNRVFYYRDNALIYVDEKEELFQLRQEEGGSTNQEMMNSFMASFSFHNGILLNEQAEGKRKLVHVNNPEDYYVNMALKYQRKVVNQ